MQKLHQEMNIFKQKNLMKFLAQNIKMRNEHFLQQQKRKESTEINTGLFMSLARYNMYVYSHRHMQ